MKVSYDAKNKKTNVEADVERLVEKGMDQHDKNWKEKFDTKHKAKKEILEIKHRQKMDLEESNKTKKNWFQKIVEEKRKIKELELEEQRRREAEEQKRKNIVLAIKIITTIILSIICLTMLLAGIIIGATSGDPDSAWYGLTGISFIPGFGIMAMWINNSEAKQKKKK